MSDETKRAIDIFATVVQQAGHLTIRKPVSYTASQGSVVAPCPRDPCCGEPDACDPDRHLRGERVVEAMAAIQEPVPVPTRDDRPAFKVIRPSDGHVMAVYVDGRTEGFPDDHTILVNEIPLLLHAARHNGPAPILYYDVGIDERRPITQAEFDGMIATLNRIRQERDEARESALSLGTQLGAALQKIAALTEKLGAFTAPEVAHADGYAIRKAYDDPFPWFHGRGPNGEYMFVPMLQAHMVHPTREAAQAVLDAISTELSGLQVVWLKDGAIVPETPAPANAFKHREHQPWRMGPGGG